MIDERDPERVRLVTGDRSEEEFEKRFSNIWATIPPEDSLLKALSEFSGRDPAEHKRDAFLIFTASVFEIDKPKQHIERARRLYSAVNEIERVVCSMSQPEAECLMIDAEEEYSSALYPDREPGSRQSSFYEKSLFSFFVFMLALKTAAKNSEGRGVNALKRHGPKSKNMNATNIQVALLVSDVFVRIAKREPPKSGDNGPFQRLLRDVYLALGRENIDLRGPLRKVHEYRKNRHS